MNWNLQDYKGGKTMKKLLTLLTIFTLVLTTPVKAEELTMRKMTMTCYLPTGNKTCTGIEPYYGIAAAKKSWVGKKAIIYERTPDNKKGKYIGTFDIQDTGLGHNNSIPKGYVIDIFVEKEEDIIPTQKVFVTIVDTEAKNE